MIEIFTETKFEQYDRVRAFFTKLDNRLREMYQNGNSQNKRGKYFIKKISSIMCIYNILYPDEKRPCSCLCKNSFLDLFPNKDEYIHFYYHGNDAFNPGEKIKIRFIYYSPQKESHILLQKKITSKMTLPNNLEENVLTDILNIVSQITTSIDSTETGPKLGKSKDAKNLKTTKKTLLDLKDLLNSDSGPKSWNLSVNHNVVESTKILDDIKNDLSLVNVMLSRDIEYSYSLPSGKQVGDLYRQFSEIFSDEKTILG